MLVGCQKLLIGQTQMWLLKEVQRWHRNLLVRELGVNSQDLTLGKLKPDSMLFEACV